MAQMSRHHRVIEGLKIMMQNLKQFVTHPGFRVGLQLGAGQSMIALWVFIRNPFSVIAWVGSINHPAVSMLLSQVSATLRELPHQCLQLSTSACGPAEPPHRDSAAGSSPKWQAILLWAPFWALFQLPWLGCRAWPLPRGWASSQPPS